jgi:hypothetical protein
MEYSDVRAMKVTPTTMRFATGLCLWLLALLVAPLARGQATTFVYTLDEPCKTSAGVYASDGTLVRTLWSKVRYYSAGTYTNFWDGLDDSGNSVAAGTYQIKILEHNTEYVWDGAIGNTSDQISGPTVHRGFWPMADMSISGTNGFYCSGYNEGMYDFRAFDTTDPQSVVDNFAPGANPADVYDQNWLWTTADSNHVYYACSASLDTSNQVNNAGPGFILAFNVSDQSHYSFSSGVPIPNGTATGGSGPDETYANGIYVGTQPGLSGLSVQQNGNLLAASVGADNKVYLLDKAAGTVLSSISVSNPGRLNFSPDGSLWVISGTSVIQYTNVGAAPAIALTIANFKEPLDVAISPTNAALVLVADAGSSQQIKAFDNTGASLWTYGLAGGYQTNGAAVSTNKFWFTDGENDETFICFAPDGTFWVGDGGNSRAMHFSAPGNYIEQIMYQPHTYLMCVDQNNPNRVFNQFLEFKVDYNKPLQQSWTLVNNWQANVDPAHISWDGGLRDVTTFTNGHTYALIDNNSFNPVVEELCELSSNQLRFTGIYPLQNMGDVTLGPDGSVRAASIGVATWYETTLYGFDTTNNPVWNSESLMASASGNATDPMLRCCGYGGVRTPVSTNNILISFDQSLNNGYHLGGVKLGSNKWLWKASPAVAYMNGLGTYEISNGVTYGGNTVQAIGRNIVYGYYGEFFRGEGQASQNMHFYDDGLFVGQFGEASPGHSAYEGAIPGFAGNSHCSQLMETTNGDYYVWDNDEAGHGPQRWHLANARNIREQSGTGPMGSTIILTNPPSTFPVNIQSENGYQAVELSWPPVTNATFYNIYYSRLNGGPYHHFAGSTTFPNYVITGLTNGQTYYFAVSAVQGGVEGMVSEQVPAYPFDTNQTVLCAGSVSEGGQFTPVINVNTTNPNSGLPAWLASVHLTGTLAPRELDYEGYGNLQNETLGVSGVDLLDYEGSATSLQNILAPFTYSYGGGWVNIDNLGRVYDVLDQNHESENDGLATSTTGTLNIGATDNNYHYLTVVSPAQFNYPRNFTLGITSTNGTTASYSINENPGYSHVFQFMFKGNVTLSAAGSGAIIQSFFLDNASTYTPQPLLPPVIQVKPH